MRTLRLAFVVLMQIAFMCPAGVCVDLKAFGKHLMQQIEIKDFNLSPCCNDIIEDCASRSMECVDYKKPKLLIDTCRCRITAKMEMTVVMETCMRAANKVISIRLQRELNNIVIRKMPGQLATSAGAGYVEPGENSDVGAKQPDSINRNAAKLSGLFGR